MDKATQTTETYYVVRNKNGKFVRAFITEAQAQRWTSDNKTWTYAIEEPHPADQQGHVFDLYRKAGK